MSGEGKRQKMLARRNRGRLIAVLGCMVVVATALALMVPALSMTRGDLVCGLEEHVHTDECYEAVLVCGLEEGEDHEHDADCYEYELVCELPEHTHSSACYAEPEQDADSEDDAAGSDSADGAGAAEGADNEGADASNGSEGGSDAASGDSKSGESGAAEASGADSSGGAMTSAGAAAVKTESDGASEDVAGEGDDSMPAQKLKAELVDEDGKVVLTVAVDAPKGAFPAGVSMRADGVLAKDVQKRVKDALIEVVGDGEGSAEGEGTGAAAAAAAGEGSASNAVVIERMVGVDIAFFDADGNQIQPAKKVNVKISGEQVRKAQNLVLVHVLEADGVVKNADGSLVDSDGKSFKDDADAYKSAELVKDVKLVNEDEDDDSEGNENTLSFKAQEFSPYVLVELSDSAMEALQASSAADAVIDASSAHSGDGDDEDSDGAEGAAGSEDGKLITTEDRPEQSFQQDVKGANGATALSVSVTAPEGALPAGVTMVVELVNDDEVLDAAKDQAAADGALGEDVEDAKAAGARVQAVAADITFLDAEGNKVEPAADLQVTMATPAVANMAADSLAVVHVADDLSAQVVEGAEVDQDAESVAFDAGEFSVYAIVYTVDFHYEIDGKTFGFSISGGGFISLGQIVELLGIANEAEGDSGAESVAGVADGAGPVSIAAETIATVVDAKSIEISEATKAFIANVESVEFSNPNLVWVGKAVENTTVGALKAANGLEAQYSAALTEEQITQIDAQTVDAGDWALISLLPFTSEETLTVTMRNGERFVVKVTDAQKPYKDPDEIVDGYYLIYTVSNGTNVFLRTNGGKSTSASVDNNYRWYVHNNGNGTFTIRNPSGQYINLYGTVNSQNSISQIANSTSPVNVTLTKNGSNGIRLSYNNKYLGCNGYGNNQGFYPSSSGSNLIFYGLDESSGNIGVDGLVLTDAERAKLEEWENTLEKFNTLTDSEKTAEVREYDNRMYRIDISASSGITDFYKDVDLGFVLDVSNSMNFPSSLAPLKRANGTDVSISMDPDTFDELLRSSDFRAKYEIQNCFYIISDPALTSTIYRIYKNGSDWKYMDASGGTEYPLTTDTVFKEVYKKPYVIYYADDTKTRFTYLKESVNYSIDILNKIVTPTEVDDGTASVRIAYNLFAGNSQTIKNSDTFKDLRDRGDTMYSLNWSATDSGTKQNEALYDGGNNLQGYSANEFGWDTSSTTDKYVILVTDGAPNGPSMNDVRTAAQNLKNAVPGLKIISIGLSTQDVDGGSQMLYDIADNIGGVRQFYEAEKAQDLEYILLKILRTIMAEGLVRGTVTDTIDSAFYPVDSSGNPLSAGVYNANGKIVGTQVSDYVSNGKPTAAHASEAFYTWEQVGDEWKITWYNQEIGWDDNDSTTGNPWTGTVYVKAKEDYLGGNLIETNDGNAQIEPTGIKLVINGQAEQNWRPLENMPKINLPVPRVNVHNLETAQNSTTWTVYKGTTVTPQDQIKALWDNIPIEEVVSASENGLHKRTTGSDANVGTGGAGEAFTLSSLMAEVAPTFDIDNLISQITSSNGSASTSFEYTAYGHKSGTITVTVKRTVGTQVPQAHNADTVASPAEQYQVIFAYTPYTEVQRMDGKVKDPTDEDHHNGANGRGNEEKGTITSTNTHTINVFQKGIEITKVDKTSDAPLSGATFALYRADANGTADVSAYNLPSGGYTLISDTLTSNSDGKIEVDPVFPDDAGVAGKTLYLPNIAVGATSETSHDSVFYLVEKTPPTKDGVTYAKMPGAIKLTMTLEEDKGTVATADLYDWAQTAIITATGYGNEPSEYLVTNGEDGGIFRYKIKNGRPTDITLIKVDKTTGASIGGAKFRLMQGSSNVDLSGLTITAINGGAIAPENYDLNGTRIKVITVPEGGIRIAGLSDATYTLSEVAAPDGYLVTDEAKAFKTYNGAIKNADDSSHENEAADIAFKVENTPGAPLPNTGGLGAELFYFLGATLMGLAGAGLVINWRRRNAA